MELEREARERMGCEKQVVKRNGSGKRRMQAPEVAREWGLDVWLKQRKDR